MKKKKKIWVIEDSIILAEMIKVSLETKFSCEVICYDSPDNLIEHIDHGNPDIITLDYNFNGSEVEMNNGLDFLIALRKQSDVPVIVFSGQRDMATAIEMLSKGANDYIDKDKDDFLDELIDSVNDVIGLLDSNAQLNRLERKKKDLKKYFVLLLLIGVSFFTLQSLC